MLRTLLNKNHEKFDSIPTDGSISNTKVFAKAFACGAREGAIEGLVILGAVTLAVLTVAAVVVIALPTSEETE